MKIYRLEQQVSTAFEFDSSTGGAVAVSRARVQPSSDERIAWPTGETFEIGEDGTFEVPERVANHFLRMRDAGWREGDNPFAEQLAAQPKAKPAVKAKPRAVVEDHAPKGHVRLKADTVASVVAVLTDTVGAAE